MVAAGGGGRASVEEGGAYGGLVFGAGGVGKETVRANDLRDALKAAAGALLKALEIAL